MPVKHRRPREVAAVAASSARDGAPAAPMEPETQQVDANARPVYVVQVMQAGGCIKVGDRDAEYINRPSICESTTAQHLHKTLEPWVRADVLTSAQRDGDHSFLGMYGDSLAANKLVITQVESATRDANIPLHDGWCVGHQLSLASDEQIVCGFDVINPLYAAEEVLQHTQSRAQLLSGYDYLAKNTLVMRGVSPPVAFEKLHRDIVEHTLGDGQWESLFAVRNPGTDEHGLKDQALLQELLHYFNGDWAQDQWQHYCVKSRADRRPCCETIKHSKDKMADIMKRFSCQFVWDRITGSTKKWCQNPRRSSTLAVLVAVHHSFPQVVAQRWGCKSRSSESSDHSEEQITDSYHAKKTKRRSKAVRFWANRKATGLLIRIGITSKPIRDLLGKHFAAEREAKIRTTLQERDHPPPSLMGSFTRTGGHLDQAIAELNDLLGDNSPLLAKHCCPSVSAITTSRGMILRGIGRLKFRLTRKMKLKTCIYECIHSIDDSTEGSFIDELMKSKKCCLEGYWELRVHNGFKKHEQTLHIRPQDQLLRGSQFRELMQWVGFRHPLFVISARETDHADLVNKWRSSRWWCQGILPLMVDQQLERWLSILPKRVTLTEGTMNKPKEQTKKKRKNQHTNEKPSMMLPEVIKLVNTALPELERQRQREGNRLGSYLAYRTDELKKAKLQSPGTWSIERVADFNKAC